MGAAKALLAKVYLTMAGWPLEDTSKYADARDKAAEVMNLSYGLEPNFSVFMDQINHKAFLEAIYMSHQELA